LSNVGFATLSIIPSAKGFASALGGEVNPAMSRAGKEGGGLFGKSLLPSIGGLAVAAGGLFAAAGVGGFFKDAVAGAANLEQSVGAIETVFKTSAPQMLSWADGAATAVGLTKNEYAELGTLIGTQLRNGGTAMDELAPKTNNLIGLGADLSSMFGGTTSDAVSALSSALKGERDPIERYGVSLTQAAIDAKAAELGFAKVGGTLSAEANQAATLALIMDQTSDAHGNFGREADTLSHKQQVLNAMWEDGKTRIGGALVPAISALTGMLISGLGPALSGAERGITKVTEVAGGVFNILGKGEFTPFAGLQEDSGVVDFLFRIREGFLSTAEAVGGAFGPYVSQIAGAFASLVGPLASVLPSLSPFGIILQGLLPVLPQVAALVGSVAATLAGALAGALTSLAPALSSLATLLAGTLAAALPAVLPLIGTLAGVFATLVPVIAGVLASVLPLVTALISGLAPVITTLISSVLPPLLTVFSSLVAVIAPIVAQIAGALIPIIAALIPVVLSIVSAIAPLVVQLVSALAPVLTSIAPLFGMLVSAIMPVVTMIAGLLMPIISALMPVVTTVFGVIVSVITAALQIVQGIIQVVTGVISGNWSQVWSGLGNIVSGAWNLIKSVITGALSIVGSVISAALNLIRSIFSGAWNALTGVVSGAWSGITGAISSGVSSAVSFVSGLPGKILSALSSLGSLLISVGTNMMQGLIQGVQAAAGRIKDAVLGPIKDSVEAVKGFLGIHSPSRLFIGIGEFTGQGMAIGLRNTAGLIARASDALIPAIPETAYDAPAVRPGGLYGASGSRGAGGDTHITVYEAVDAAATAADVARRKKGQDA